MRRDWDVIRTILLKVEGLPSSGSLTSGDLDGVDPGIAGFNMGLLIDAGLLKGVCLNTGGPSYCHASKLTWSGCEFLDEIRKDTAWEKIKEKARDKGLDLTIDVVKGIAKSFMTQML